MSQQSGDLVVVHIHVYAVHHLLRPAKRLTQPAHTDANVKAAGSRLVQTWQTVQVQGGLCGSLHAVQRSQSSSGTDVNQTHTRG